MAIGQKWEEDLRKGWEVVRGRGLAISLRQFVSILALLGIRHQGGPANLKGGGLPIFWQFRVRTLAHTLL
jgi:hypothetical protein